MVRLGGVLLLEGRGEVEITEMILVGGCTGTVVTTTAGSSKASQDGGCRVHEWGSWGSETHDKAHSNRCWWGVRSGVEVMEG